MSQCAPKLSARRRALCALRTMAWPHASLVLRWGRTPMAQHYKLQFSHWEHVTPLPASPWPPGIPQRIHISCIASSDVLDSPVRTVPFWQALNPTFSVEVHNHTASRDFLAREYPQPVVERYDAIPQWAHRVRSDLWRVAYLLKYGGVYADSDIEPIVGVKQMVGPNVVKPIESLLVPIATGNSGQVREIVQCDLRTRIATLSMSFLLHDSR